MHLTINIMLIMVFFNRKNKLIGQWMYDMNDYNQKMNNNEIESQIQKDELQLGHLLYKLREYDDRIKSDKNVNTYQIYEEIYGNLNQVKQKKRINTIGKIGLYMLQNNKSKISISNNLIANQLHILKYPQFKIIHPNIQFINLPLRSYLTLKFILQSLLTQSHIQLSTSLKLYQLHPIIYSYFQYSPNSTQTFLQLVLKTQKSKHNQNNAAIAITLLNISGFKFSGLNLSEISIPGATLCKGYFQKTNFENANLSNVNFFYSYLLNTNFKNTNLIGTNFDTYTINFNQSINCTDIDSNQQYLLVGSSFGLLRLYKINTFKIAKQWYNQQSPYFVSFLKINHTVLVVSYQDITIYDYKYDKIIQNIKFNQINLKNQNQIIHSINSIVFHYKSNELVFTGTGDTNKIFFYDLQLNQIKLQIQTDQYVKFLRPHTDQKKIIAATLNPYSIKIWQKQKGSKIKQIKCEKQIQQISCINNQMIITGHSDKSIIIWNLLNSETVKIIRTELKPKLFKYNMVYDELFIGFEEGNIKIFNIGTGAYIKQFNQHRKRITQIFILKNGKQFVSTSLDQKIKFHQQSQWKIRILQNNNNAIQALEYSPLQNEIAYACDNSIKIWSKQLKRIIKILRHNTIVYSVTYINSQQLASGTLNGQIKIWKISKEESILLLGHKQSITKLIYNKVQNQLISSSTDKTIIIWNLQNKTIKKQFKYNSAILAISHSKYRNILAGGASDSSIIIWNLQNGKQQRIMKGHKQGVNSLDFNRNNINLISGSRDKKIIIWGLINYEMIKVIDSEVQVLSLLYINEKYIGYEIAGNRLRILNSEDDRECRDLSGHVEKILSLRCSQDGKQLISGSLDRTVKIWNLENMSYSLLGSIPQCRLQMRGSQFKNAQMGDRLQKYINEIWSQNKKVIL